MDSSCQHDWKKKSLNLRGVFDMQQMLHAQCLSHQYLSHYSLRMEVQDHDRGEAQMGLLLQGAFENPLMVSSFYQIQIVSLRENVTLHPLMNRDRQSCNQAAPAQELGLS